MSKRQAIAPVNAELPVGDRPHPPPASGKDIKAPVDYPWRGSAGSELATLRAENDRLRARVTTLTFLLERVEAHMLGDRKRRADADSAYEAIVRELNPKLETNR